MSFENMFIEQVLTGVGQTFEERDSYYLINCPYHDDRHPDMKIYKNSGMCVCFACGERVHITKFAQDKNYNIDKKKLTFPIPKKLEYPERILLKYPKGYSKLIIDIIKWGISDEMIDTFNLGYCRFGYDCQVDVDLCSGCYFYDPRWISRDHCWFAHKRMLIPCEREGILYDIESRDTTGRAAKKVLFPHKGKNSLTIFNYDNLKKDQPLYVVEGKKAALRIWKDIDRNVTAIFSNRVKGAQKELLKRFNHIILIPDLGEAGEMMVKDFKDLSISKLEIVRLPKVLLCKKCKTKFRGTEKMDICPSCKDEKVSYMDAFDFETEQLKLHIKNRTLAWLERAQETTSINFVR